MVKIILDELNFSNSLNHKRAVLKKHKDNPLFKRVCAMTYDKVKYTYGISLKNINVPPLEDDRGAMRLSLDAALDILETEFCTRKFTGNRAIEELQNILMLSNNDNRYVIERIIERDLKVNIGKTEMNKVWKDLITKPAYMRCSVLGSKTLKKICFKEGAILQLKADGTYRSITVEDGKVQFESRSGEPSEFPLIASEMALMPNGVYIGEALVEGIDNRAESNGLINSSEPPHEKIYIQLWDFVSLEEFYERPKDKTNKVPYIHRFESLKNVIPKSAPEKRVTLIPTVFVNDIKQAVEKTAEWMQQGYEGGILKCKKNIFCDHTSPTQLKIKLEIDVDVRITGFTEGKKGTRRENTFGAITFETDDGKIKGQTSGFSDEQLADFNSRRTELVGQVMTVQCNDITKGRDNDFYALSHPRFIELRTDKDTTDDLERVLELRDLAMTIKDE